MAEQVQRYRQYEYRANSNLVLTTDQHRPRTDEPSGEPESLKDYLDGTRFGDRVAHAKPDVVDGGRKRKSDKSSLEAKRAKKKAEKESVLGLADDMDAYRPRSKETRQAYEVGFGQPSYALLLHQIGVYMCSSAGGVRRARAG